jgi:hypothetical protein
MAVVEQNTHYITDMQIPLWVAANPKMNGTDMMVFWIIKSVSFKSGKCFASNMYFADLLQVEKRTIQTSIRKVADAGLIDCNYDGEVRIITIREDAADQYKDIAIRYNEVVKNSSLTHDGNITYPMTETSRTPCRKLHHNIDNTITNNNISSKNKVSYETTGLPKRSPERLAKIPIEEVPKKVRCFFRLWEEHGLHMPANNTKSYRKCIKAIEKLFDGSMFHAAEFNGQRRKYDNLELELAINRFADAATNPHTLPIATYKKLMQKMTLSDFIYNEFAKPNGGDFNPRSMFLYYLQHEPKTVATPVVPIKDDPYPVMTKSLKEVYKQKVLGNANTTFTIREENDFILAAEKVKKFWLDNIHKIGTWAGFTDKAMAEIVVDSVLKSVDNPAKISTGYINSDYTMRKRLPQELNSQGLLRDLQ